MRFTSVLVAVFSVPFSLPGQTVDLTKWKVEKLTGNGIFVNNAVKSRTVFTNRSIYDRSVLYSDTTLLVINFRLRVSTTADDDFIGFVLGFQPGDGSNQNADYLLVDWKQRNQSYGNWGLGKAGLALSRVTGVGTGGTGGGTIDFWSHTGVVKELARGTTFGSTGWKDNTEYKFSVLFTPANVSIWVNDQLEFNVNGTFKTGRFGCYNFSQTAMNFQFPVTGALVPYGKGCSGKAGTPSLSASKPPMLGEDFKIEVTQLPSTGPATLVLGVSDKTWNGILLPFNMGLIGGTGCTLLSSAEFFLPLTASGGTWSITLPLPNDPGLLLFPFFCQATGIDFSANALGMVFSNAGAGKAGIR